MAIFADGDKCARLYTSFSKSFTQKGLAGKQALTSTGQTLSSESLTDAEKTNAISIGDGISETIKQVLSAEGLYTPGDVSHEKGLQAATMIAKLGSFDVYKNVAGTKAASANAGVVTSEQLGYNSGTVFGSLGNEAYSEQEYDNSLYYSIMFNYAVVRQEDLIEAFFPTIVIDPAQTAIEVEISLLSYMKDFVHPLDGSPIEDTMEKDYVIKTLYSEKWLASNNLKIVPVLKAETAARFMTDLTVVDSSGYETVDTAPLLVNQDHNLISLSATDLMLDRGIMDRSDYLDKTLKVKNIYVKVTSVDGTGADVSETFRIPLSIYLASNFMPVQQGEVRRYQLNFETNDIILDSTLKTAKNSISNIFKTLLAANAVKLHVSLSGKVDLRTGTMSVAPIKTELYKVYDTVGNEISKKDPSYATILAGFKSIEVTAYDPEAYRTNENTRTPGVYLTSDVVKHAYQVPFLSDTSILGPEVKIGGNLSDLSTISSVIVSTGARQSLAGFKRLKDTATELSYIAKYGISANASITGIGRYFVNPYFIAAQINVNESVDSMSSSDRFEDVSAMLRNKLRDAAMEMALNSNYYVAYRTLRPGKPLRVVIGTGARTKMYIMGKNNEDVIKLSDEIEAYVYATPYSELEGVVYMSFATDEGSKDSKMDPFNFGNTIWSPSFVVDVKKQTNGANNRLISNVPRYAHIVNLPVLYYAEISDFGSVLGKVSKNVNILGTVEIEQK